MTRDPAESVSEVRSLVFVNCSDDYLFDTDTGGYVCRRSDEAPDYDFRTRLTDESYGAGFVG
jgi:hypothetical protein